MNPRYGAQGGRLQPSWLTRLSALALFALLPSLLPAADAAPALPAVDRGSRTILVMGDSLSAAYGLEPAEGWVALTGERLRASHPGWTVANASISGETTAGGASRIAGELQRHAPAVVVIELGANDGLRGLPLDQTRTNLEKMIVAARASGARVLLVGMRMPPNYGSRYTEAFAAIYQDLARKHEASLLPFLLEPIASERSAFQADNLHPVADAQPRLRDHVWTALEPLLR